MADCDDYVDFWRNKTWEEQLSELQQTPEPWAQSLLEFSALIYDQETSPLDLIKDEIIEIGDQAMVLATEYARQEWKWMGMKLIAAVEEVGFSESKVEAKDDAGSGGAATQPEDLPWVIVDEDDVLDLGQIKEHFLLYGKPLRCENKPAVLAYLKTRKDVLCYETASGETQTDDNEASEGKAGAPEGEQPSNFAEDIGGREGFFVNLTKCTLRCKDPSQRVANFLLVMGLYFPHF